MAGTPPGPSVHPSSRKRTIWTGCANIRQAVLCHFGDAPECPKVARLHFIRDEVMTL